MMKDFKAALQFLTILPLGRPQEVTGQQVVALFPLAGLLIGLLLALMDSLLQTVFPLHIVSLMDVLFLAVVTGGLHLDGLADTADGLFSHRTREEALRIMKDSRVGTMGLLALIFLLSIKWASLSSLHGQRMLSLIVIPAYGRGAFTVAIQWLHYVRPEGGTGGTFFQGRRTAANCRWLLGPVALSLLLGLKGIFLNLAFAAIVGLVTGYYKRRMGGITGDMLGALGEITEAGLFLLLAMGA